MRNKSLGELTAGSPAQPCTCYMRRSPLVQSHINVKQPSDPESSQGRQGRVARKQRRGRPGGRAGQRTRAQLLPSVTERD